MFYYCIITAHSSTIRETYNHNIEGCTRASNEIGGLSYNGYRFRYGSSSITITSIGITITGDYKREREVQKGMVYYLLYIRSS